MIHRRYRIVSAPRFVTFLVLLILITVVAITTAAGVCKADGLSETQYRNVLVESGDTLWDIAAENCASESGDSVDIRDIVDDICQENGITASELRAGDVIRVPVVL